MSLRKGPVRSRGINFFMFSRRPPVNSDAANFDFYMDMKTSVAPTGLVCTRTGDDVYLARSLATVVAVAANLPLYEDRGGDEGGGYWSFPGFTNDLAGLAFDFSSGAGWAYLGTPAPTFTANDGLAPDGIDMADKLNDVNASTFSAVQKAGLVATNCGYSLWTQEATPAPGRPGCLAGDATPTVGVTFPTGASWRRSSLRATSGTQNQFTIWPAGVRVGSVDHTYTGAIRVWGAQRVRTVNLIDLPLVNGTSSDCVLSLGASALAEIVDANGDINLELGYIPQVRTIADYGSGTAHYIFSFLSNGGLETSIRWDTTNARFIFKRRGTDFILTNSFETSRGGTTNQYFRENDEYVIRLWDLPSKVGTMGQRECGLRIFVNGCCGLDKRGTTTGSAYSAPTVCYLGSNGVPTTHMGMRWTKFGRRKTTSELENDAEVEGVIFGDSTWATRNNDYICPGIAMRTVSQSRTRGAIGSMATSGDTAAGQKTKWDAATCTWRGMLGIYWAIIGVGINDIAQQVLTLAQIIANIQSLNDRAKATNPGIKTLVFALDPIKAYLDTLNVNLYPDFWVPLNDAIMGVATAGNNFTIITDVDARVNEHLIILDPSSTGTTIAGYQVGDNLHVNNPGRAVKANVAVAKLTALGFTP